MGRHLEIEWQDDTQRLFRHYQQERLPDVRPRLHGLWLLRTGHSLSETASVLGVHYTSVQRWVAWYRRGGIAAVRTHRRVGRGKAPMLSPEQQQQFRDQLALGVFHTAKDAMSWVAQRFGVHYTQKGMYSLLSRLKGGKKVPRPMSTNTSRQAQEAWKKGGLARR
jgi:transposase